MDASMRIKEIRKTIEAIPEPGISLEALVAIQKALGNQVLRIDRARNCVVLADTREVIHG